MSAPGMDRGTTPPRRLVLVTGASRGIGAAIAEAFGAEGARVVINHVDTDEQARASADAVERAGGEAVLVRADVGDPAQAQRLVADVTRQHGVVDVLVNNAGICPFTDFFDLDVETWDRVHAVNLRAAFVTSQAVARTMVDAGRPGRLIAISSISAWVGGAQQVHYCPTKAGLSSLMRSLAIVLGPHGITCNAVLPGCIATDSNSDDLARPGKADAMAARIPLGRLGRPADVAPVVTFLASPAAAYVTGAELLCDGGLFVNLQ